MTIDEDTGSYWRPALAGAWLLFTDPATPESPPADNFPVDSGLCLPAPRPLQPVLRGPRGHAVLAGGVETEVSVHWLLQAGQYAVTPDHRPLIGPTKVEGLWVNSGYSGHGIMLGPAGSRHLVDLFTGKAESNPFAPDRAFEEREPPRG